MATIAEALTVAIAHHQAGRLQPAEQIYRQILAVQPNHAGAWNLLGVINSQCGNHQAAADCIGRAIELHASSPAFHNNLGNVYAKLSRADDAIACYRRALELKPDYAEAHNNLGKALRDQNRLDEAIGSYRRALEFRPDYADALNNLGNPLLQQGRLDEAVACYLRALEVNPDFAEAHSNLAGALLSQGKHAEAADHCRRALELKPDYPEAHVNLGNALRSSGHLDLAAACYRRALNLDPNNAEALTRLANALGDNGSLDEAISCYRAALKFRPDVAEVHYNLGNVLKMRGHLDDAVDCYRRALELRPDFADAHNNLGTVLQDFGQTDQAIARYRHALELHPGLAAAHNNLGQALKEQGKPHEALACYRRAVELKPDFAEAYSNLGSVLEDLGRLHEAVACHRHAVASNPRLAEVHMKLGNALLEQEQLDEALACFHRALDLRPNSLYTLGLLVYELQRVCLWDDLHGLSRRIIELVDENTPSTTAAPLSPFCFVTLSTPTTAEQQLRCARQWVDAGLKSGKASGALARTRPSSARPRITVGYLSADFHSHATAMLVAELFEKHDRSQFAVFGYSYGPDASSPMRRRIIAGLDRFVDLKDVSSTEAGQRIAADDVDILVDLKGYTRGARTEILASRPAPVQVNYLGYPGTMGAPFIDYILVDDFIVPADQQPFYSERLVHLPHCYQVNDSRRAISPRTPSRAECGLPDNGFVFCSFNNTCKITPEVLGVWMDLLRATDGSVLWLLETSRFAPANLRREAQRRGVAAGRLVFAPLLEPAEHLARHRLADLFLDTFPVNAHTTASDALWAGCPILTLAGETFVSRVAGSLLHTLGLPELVATSLHEYATLALRLARNGKELLELRARLETNRAMSPLFDGGRFAANLEKAYQTMWELHQSGGQPRGFRLSPT